MLKLAPPAFGEMPAWRGLMMRPRLDPVPRTDAIAWRRQCKMAAIAGNSIAATSDANNHIIGHRQAAKATGR
jgi:hypothetical protein